LHQHPLRLPAALLRISARTDPAPYQVLIRKAA
jgi:hypothetical protein